MARSFGIIVLANPVGGVSFSGLAISSSNLLVVKVYEAARSMLPTSDFFPRS